MHYVFGKFYPQLMDQVGFLINLSGSWYRGHEIARRGGIFYTGLNLGTLTAGLIAAGASHRLEGVQGMSGCKHKCSPFTVPRLFCFGLFQNAPL